MKERPRGGYHWLKTTLSGSAPVVLTWSRGEEDEKWRTSPSVLHWYKNEKYNTRVEDEEGCPVFSLVNKAIGEALKHSIGVSHLVRLIPYNPDYLDESILWTESRDLGDGHRAIRMVNNVHLNVDAFQGDKNSGGVHDGTTIVLWDWNRGDNQQWKILPY